MRWVDASRYILLAGSLQGRDIVLVEIGRSSTALAENARCVPSTLVDVVLPLIPREPSAYAKRLYTVLKKSR